MTMDFQNLNDCVNISKRLKAAHEFPQVRILRPNADKNLFSFRRYKDW